MSQPDITQTTLKICSTTVLCAEAGCLGAVLGAALVESPNHSLQLPMLAPPIQEAGSSSDSFIKSFAYEWVSGRSGKAKGDGALDVILAALRGALADIQKPKTTLDLTDDEELLLQEAWQHLWHMIRGDDEEAKSHFAGSLITAVLEFVGPVEDNQGLHLLKSLYSGRSRGILALPVQVLLFQVLGHTRLPDGEFISFAQRAFQEHAVSGVSGFLASNSRVRNALADMATQLELYSREHGQVTLANIKENLDVHLEFLTLTKQTQEEIASRLDLIWTGIGGLASQVEEGFQGLGEMVVRVEGAVDDGFAGMKIDMKELRQLIKSIHALVLDNARRSVDRQIATEQLHDRRPQ